MFKIEPTERRDTFRLRSTQHPAILFEVSAITKDAYEFLGEFREHLEVLLLGALQAAAVKGPKNAVTEYTDADKLSDLLKIVIEMRTAQKAFFRNKKTSDLEASKLLERKLDALVAELSKGGEVQAPTDWRKAAKELEEYFDTAQKEQVGIAEALESLEGHLAKTAFAKAADLLKFRLDADFDTEFRETITADQWKQWALDALNLTNYQPRTEQTTTA